ncbi:sigma-70 region 2 family protein [Mycobacterium kansasii]|uniref:Sigma-70 region 2 family protein n=1 Tax=Mycobacterium kansasii TaxID=1768 RepID=A0A1V3XJ90_MYCKA|nr:sigma-70 region 2 family protein [Mycobacterium kansasii]
MTQSPGEHAQRFTLLRPMLFTIAYEILGSATESEDVLQDSYVRWAGVDLETVRDTKSYLAQLVTRQALNALRAGARRREEYVGRGCRSHCCSTNRTRLPTSCWPNRCRWRCWSCWRR